jgi:RimJ/RimL family protein N-acetyltransferase
MEEESSGGAIMTKEFFQGNLVELTPLDLERDLVLLEKWDRDSDYQRLLNMNPAAQFSSTMTKDWFENNPSEGAFFIIRTLEDQKVIGFVDLGGYEWTARNAWVGIAIGESEFRSKGYGTDAMNVLLRYAFRALNLHRVNLGVFEFNKRAIRCYEKCGFKYEGTNRESIYKEDKRWDVFNMGILRSEWEALQEVPVN